MFTSMMLMPSEFFLLKLEQKHITVDIRDNTVLFIRIVLIMREYKLLIVDNIVIVDFQRGGFVTKHCSSSSGCCCHLSGCCSGRRCSAQIGRGRQVIPPPKYRGARLFRRRHGLSAAEVAVSGQRSRVRMPIMTRYVGRW